MRNDKTDKLVFLYDKGKLSPLGQLGKKINANTIYKNLLDKDAKEAKGIINPLTFRNYVRNKGKWDLKKDKNSIFGLGNDGNTKFLFQGKEYTSPDLGNHHFGVVGKAYGLFSETFMLQQAGAAQIKAGTSLPEWQRYKVTTTYETDGEGPSIKVTHYEMLPPYGDDPEDQELIKEGFKYYEDMKKQHP